MIQSHLRNEELEKYFGNTLKIFCQMQKWAMWLNFAQQYESYFYSEGFKVEIYKICVQSLIDELV